MNSIRPQALESTRTFQVKKTLVIFICVLLAFWSLLWAWASITTIRAEQVITQWEQNKKKFAVDESHRFEARLLNSLKLNPLSANTYLLLGRLYEQQAVNLNSQAQRKAIENSEKYYLVTLKKLHTWDYAWSRLANFYSNFYGQLNSYDNINVEKKLQEAITQTIFIGPYELESQKTIIPLLFKHWELISKSNTTKEQAEQILLHSTQYRESLYTTLTSAKRYNKIDVLTSLLTNKKHIQTLIHYQKQLEKDTPKELIKSVN